MRSTLESLEGRSMLSAEPTFRISRSTLFIHGTTGDDHIVVSRQDDLSLAAGISSARVIAADGTINTLSAATINASRLRSGSNIFAGGSTVGSGSSAARDFPPGPYFRIDMQSGVTFVPTLAAYQIQVDGGAGDDWIELSRDVAIRATLIGARGDDTLAGSTRGDTLSGGVGDDVLFGGASSADDRFDPGPGDDTIVKYTSRTVVQGTRQSAADASGDQIIYGRFTSLSELESNSIFMPSDGVNVTV